MTTARRFAAILARCCGTFALPRINRREYRGVLTKLAIYLANGDCAFRSGVSFTSLDDFYF
jgi:hypothetical protein